MDDLSKEDLKKRISELEAEVHGLEKDLIHDKLSGLKTRAFFEEEISIYLDAISNVNGARRKDWFGFKNLSILFFDVDHFKKINDTYGHDRGDLVLAAVARVIKEEIREGDTAARWGGEEMVVSLLGATEKDAMVKATDICRIISELRFEFLPDFKITASVGVATAEGDIAFTELIKRADQAMYSAKESGRNRVVGYSQIGELVAG